MSGQLTIKVSVYHPFPVSCKIQGDISTFKEHSVVYEDGTEEPIDSVIMGTGYSFDYPFLNPQSLIPVKVDSRIKKYI
jgi:hypothetical protein